MTVTMTTAKTAMRQLTMTDGAERTTDDTSQAKAANTLMSSGITKAKAEQATSHSSLESRDQTSETIDRNTAIGRTHRHRSVRVSDRYASARPKAWAVTFMSTSSFPAGHTRHDRRCPITDVGWSLLG